MKKTYNVQITGRSSAHTTETEDFKIGATNIKEARKTATKLKTIKGRVTSVRIAKP
jgi:hypothetical protein